MAKRKKKKSVKLSKPKQKKRGRGRPPAFDSLEDFIIGVEEYFDICKKEKKFPTKGGLAIYFGVTRETLHEYENNKGKDYSDTIKKAYLRIEESWIQSLGRQYPTGSIFYLKNAFKEHWKDNWSLSNPDGTPFMPQVVLFGSDDRLKEIMDKRKKEKGKK